MRYLFFTLLFLSPQVFALAECDIDQCPQGQYLHIDQTACYCQSVLKHSCPQQQQGLLLHNTEMDYIETDPALCQKLDFDCKEGYQARFDQHGCGCYAIKQVASPCPAQQTKQYLRHDPEICDVIRFRCIEGYQVFFDAYGCGCELQQQDSNEVLEDAELPSTIE